MQTQTLYRPVGIKELELIAQSSWNAFPPRLDWQPIFYPVLNQIYAEQIAREWNTKDAFSGYCGIVTRFEADQKHLEQYPVQQVGGALHEELWVPAEMLTIFNKHITGTIEVVNVFFGEDFKMPEQQELKNILTAFKTDL